MRAAGPTEAIERLREEAGSWDGLVSLTLHGSAVDSLAEPEPYKDIDVIFLFEDNHLADGLQSVQMFFDRLCAEEANTGQLWLWRAHSGPMHPLRSSTDEEVISLRRRPIVFFHISVFSMSTYVGESGEDRTPSPVLTSSWAKFQPLTGRPLAQLRNDPVTLAHCLDAVGASLEAIRTETRGYWHWHPDTGSPPQLEWATAEWTDFEPFEMPLYHVRWGFENFRRALPEVVNRRSRSPRALLEYVTGRELHAQFRIWEREIERREQSRLEYSESPQAFAAAHSARELRQAALDILEALEESIECVLERPVLEIPFHHDKGSTDLLIGAGAEAWLGRFLEKKCPDHVLVFADAAVAALHDLERWLPESSRIVEVPDHAKSVDGLERLLCAAEDAGLTHDSLIIVTGGGTTGNVGGMVAGLACRGVDFVHVPTTLVAQLDSSIGMKQSVNGRRAKNYFGMFHPPVATLVEPLLLADLPEEQVVSGLMEALKHGLCQSQELLDAVAAVDPARPKLTELSGIIALTIQAKLEVLADDPFEMHPSQPLELGHKVGHAVEHLSEGRIPHGVCVGFGMLAEARFGAALGFVPPETVSYVARYVKETLPAHLSPHLGADSVAEQVRHDNHRVRRGVPFVFLAAPQSPVSMTLELSEGRVSTLAAAIERCSAELC